MSQASPIARRLLGAGIALIIGSLAPWASFLGLASATGLTVGFGWITLLAGAAVVTIAADPAWLKRRRRLQAHRRAILLTLGIVSIVDCVLVILGASHSQYGAAIAPQWGVFVTLVAAIAICVVSRQVTEPP